MRVLHRAWEKVSEPRILNAIFWVGYVVTFLTGVVTLVAPPMTVTGEIGPVLAILWAYMFILGGAIGATTALRGLWAWERWGILLGWAGLAVYAIVITVLHFTSPGSRLTQLGILTLAALFFLARWVLIRGRTYGPTGDTRPVGWG